MTRPKLDDQSAKVESASKKWETDTKYLKESNFLAKSLIDFFAVLKFR